MADTDSDGEDYVFLGTALEDEETTRAGQYRKEKQDLSTTRSLPMWQQEATDEQGRRRFHGAFTGGFSAGYFNTVGSKEGFTPAAFRSSRSERGTSNSQRVEDFLDQDELDERSVVQVETQNAYDTFGFSSSEAARQTVAKEIEGRQHIIPGPIIDELVTTDFESWGVRMLLKMGWRQGRGVGVRRSAEPLDPTSRWGHVAGVGTDNTPIFELKAKRDRFGLCFDPYKNAEEFRKLKHGREGPGDAAPGKRRRGVAFGTGVLEEFDTYGEEEDYVTEVDGRVGAYQEIVSEEDEELMLPGRRAQGLQRLGAGAPQARQIGTASESLRAQRCIIRGFTAAENISPNVAHYPPPSVPKGFPEKHCFPVCDVPREATAAFSARAVEPPENAGLKHAADTLAAFVAKNGKQFEEMARQRQNEDQKFAFLRGGDGADYYQWRLEAEKEKLQPAQVTQKLPGPPPLTATARSHLLGEERLPSGAEHAIKMPTPRPPEPGITSKVAEGDRQMLRSVLGGKFTSGQQQDMQSGAALPPGLVSSFASRFATSSTVQQAAALQGGLAKASEVSAALSAMDGGVQGDGQGPRTITRSVEDWWPEPLLCKRFGVPDPNKGKARAPQVTGSRFMTDHLVLPETAASDAARAPAFLSDRQQQDPSSRVDGGWQSPACQGDSPEAGIDAGELADAFLASLMGSSENCDEGALADDAPAVLASRPEPAAVLPLAVYSGKPIDVFKAIFEDCESDNEDEEQQAGNAIVDVPHLPQPAAPASDEQPAPKVPEPNRLGNALVQASKEAAEKAKKLQYSARILKKASGKQEPVGLSKQAPPSASVPNASANPSGTNSEVLRILDALKKVDKLKKGKKEKKKEKKHSSKDAKRKTEKRREQSKKLSKSSSSRKESGSSKHKSSKSSRAHVKKRRHHSSGSEISSESSESSD
mmetsp:Transcript_8580/g.24654  ORF Transcript_8580/g.24654 Transcript_8580/m.24654 type:complete len:930 (-) Transcript_8580:62-2851(-)